MARRTPRDLRKRKRTPAVLQRAKEVGHCLSFLGLLTFAVHVSKKNCAFYWARLCGVLLLFLCKMNNKSRVSDQNGVSPLYIMLEIHHSVWEPSKFNIIFGQIICTNLFLSSYVIHLFCCLDSNMASVDCLISAMSLSDCTGGAQIYSIGFG